MLNKDSVLPEIILHLSSSKINAFDYTLLLIAQFGKMASQNWRSVFAND